MLERKKKKKSGEGINKTDNNATRPAFLYDTDKQERKRSRKMPREFTPVQKVYEKKAIKEKKAK